MPRVSMVTPAGHVFRADGEIVIGSAAAAAVYTPGRYDLAAEPAHGAGAGGGQGMAGPAPAAGGGAGRPPLPAPGKRLRTGGRQAGGGGGGAAGGGQQEEEAELRRAVREASERVDAANAACVQVRWRAAALWRCSQAGDAGVLIASSEPSARCAAQAGEAVVAARAAERTCEARAGEARARLRRAEQQLAAGRAQLQDLEEQAIAAAASPAQVRPFATTQPCPQQMRAHMRTSFASISCRSCASAGGGRATQPGAGAAAAPGAARRSVGAAGGAPGGAAGGGAAAPGAAAAPAARRAC